MKHLFTPCLSICLLLAFSFAHAQEVVKEKSGGTKEKAKTAEVRSNVAKGKSQGSLTTMKGAYTMLRQVLNDGSKDSLIRRDQLKIYTDRYFVYATTRTATDTLANYGVGTYQVKNGKVMEYVFFNSDSGSVKDTFELEIKKSGDGYTQIIHIPFQGKDYVLTEVYKRADKKMTSPLDGAWKQTRAIYIDKNGKEFTAETPTQFKIYQSGNFIWVRTDKDSATNQPVSYYGYGTFTMDNDRQSTETNQRSTFATALVGIPVTIQLKFTSKDAYQQTIAFPDGSRSIEEYERMK